MAYFQVDGWSGWLACLSSVLARIRGIELDAGADVHLRDMVDLGLEGVAGDVKGGRWCVRSANPVGMVHGEIKATLDEAGVADSAPI